jgi:peptidoglycan/LPS O-acetylase OafA/YrhL
MFGLGVCIALSWDRLLSLSEKFSARSATTRFRDGAMGFGLLGAIVGLQYLPRALDGFGLPSNLVGALDLTFSLIALALLLVVAALHRPSRWFLELRIMQWLGLVSFSLYLTHEPIILLFAYLSQANLLWVLVGLALTLPTAHAFYRYVEKPAHLFSRRFR